MSTSKFKLTNSSVGAALCLNLLFRCDDCKNRLHNGWFRFKSLWDAQIMANLKIIQQLRLPLY